MVNGIEIRGAVRTQNTGIHHKKSVWAPINIEQKKTTKKTNYVSGHNMAYESKIPACVV